MIELTQEEAVALAEALLAGDTFSLPEEFELMEKQVDPALLSGMRKLWEAAQARG